MSLLCVLVCFLPTVMQLLTLALGSSQSEHALHCVQHDCQIVVLVMHMMCVVESCSSVAGSDGFMGVIKPINDDANIAMVYVTPAGIIVSVGRGFNNLFGHDIADHIGKPLRSICKDPEEFNKLLSGAVASTAASGLARAASSVEGQDFGNLTIMHKFGDEITVHVKIMKVNKLSKLVHGPHVTRLTLVCVKFKQCARCCCFLRKSPDDTVAVSHKARHEAGGQTST